MVMTLMMQVKLKTNTHDYQLLYQANFKIKYKTGYKVENFK